MIVVYIKNIDNILEKINIIKIFELLINWHYKIKKIHKKNNKNHHLI